LYLSRIRGVAIKVSSNYHWTGATNDCGGWPAGGGECWRRHSQAIAALFNLSIFWRVWLAGNTVSIKQMIISCPRSHH
jgi:hypothetical protein